MLISDMRLRRRSEPEKRRESREVVNIARVLAGLSMDNVERSTMKMVNGRGPEEIGVKHNHSTRARSDCRPQVWPHPMTITMF